MYRMLNRNKKKGFTLIELIVVIAVLGILVLLAAPRFIGQTRRANDGRIQNDVRSAENKVAEYLVREYRWSEITDGVVNTSELDLNNVKAKDLETKPESEELYKLSDEFIDEQVRSKLGGDFLADESGLVYYYDNSIESEPIEDEENNEPEEPKEIEVNDDVFDYYNFTVGARYTIIFMPDNPNEHLTYLTRRDGIGYLMGPDGNPSRPIPSQAIIEEDLPVEQGQSYTLRTNGVNDNLEGRDKQEAIILHMNLNNNNVVHSDRISSDNDLTIEITNPQVTHLGIMIINGHYMATDESQNPTELTLNYNLIRTR